MIRTEVVASRIDAQNGKHRLASQGEECGTFLAAEPIDRIAIIRRGILASEAKRVLSSLAVTQSEAMAALNISGAVMSRKVKGQKRLPPAESERVLGIARLVGQIRNIVEFSGRVEGFDSAAWLSNWLNEPLPALGWLRPLDLLDTMEGQALVSEILAHVQGGAYA